MGHANKRALSHQCRAGLGPRKACRILPHRVGVSGVIGRERVEWAANKQMQLPKRKAADGRPATRASIIHSRFAADLQRSTDQFREQ